MDCISGDIPMVKRTENPFTTIQTLSPEILVEIFKHCLPIAHDQCSICDATQAPLLLGRVSSRWRMVSTASPYLWSRFSLLSCQFPTSRIACKESALEAIDRWISRSGSQPLSIYIYFNQDILYNIFLPEAFELITSLSWRWKDINVSVHSGLIGQILAPFRTGHLPQLENFESTMLGFHNDGAVDSLDVSSAPKLQTFRQYSGCGVHIDFGGRISHIKVLKIKNPKSGMSLSDFRQCLIHCPLLEELYVRVDLPGVSLPQKIPSIIELSHLRRLTLRHHPRIDTGCLFNVLLLPSLIHLLLAIVGDGDYITDRPQLRSMLARSCPPLQTLELYAYSINERALNECLSYIPSLIFLNLSYTACTDTILHFLTVDENGPSSSICPSLQTINFGCASRFSTKFMIAMILSRRPIANKTAIGNGGALKTVDCRYSMMGNILSNPDIIRCMGDGLQLFTPPPIHD